MQNFSITPKEMMLSFWRNRSLIWALVKREVIGRYRGSIFGVLWSFFNPLLMLVVYTFVFSVVLKARWGGGSDSKTEFAIVLFTGLMIFNLFAECINRAPTLMLSNVNYIKKVVFPLEILPWVAVGSGLFHLLVSLLVWLPAYIIFFGIPEITIVFFPLVVFPFVLFIMVISWGLASLGVYLRDVSHFIGIFTTVLLFMSPIFYPVTALPEKYRPILFLNPLTQVVEQARNVLIWGKIPELSHIIVFQLSAAIIAWLGFAWFQKTRKGFADVV